MYLAENFATFRLVLKTKIGTKMDSDGGCKQKFANEKWKVEKEKYLPASNWKRCARERTTDSWGTWKFERRQSRRSLPGQLRNAPKHRRQTPSRRSKRLAKRRTEERSCATTNFADYTMSRSAPGHLAATAESSPWSRYAVFGWARLG